MRLSKVKKYDRLKRLLTLRGILLVFVSSFALTNTTFGQDPLTRSISTKDGLPSNIVYKIDQDSLGLIWIATDNGISTYDSHSIEEKQIKNANDHFFPSMEKDAFGNFWFMNISGQLFVDCIGHVKQVEHELLVNNQNASNLVVFNDVVMLVVKNVNAEYVLLTFKIQKDCTIELLSSTENANFLSFHILPSNDSVYVTMRTREKNSLFKYIDNGNFELILDSLSEIYLRLIDLGDNNFLGLVNGKNTVHYFNQNKVIDQLHLKKNINHIIQIQDKIYLLTEAGYHILNVSDEKIRLSEASFVDNSVNHLYKSSDGLLWISTYNQGVHILRSQENKNYQFLNKTGRVSSVTSIIERKSSMIIGTNNGELIEVGAEQNKYLANLNSKITAIKSYDRKLYATTSIGLYSFDPKYNAEILLRGTMKQFSIRDANEFAISTSSSTFIFEPESLSTERLNDKSENRSYAVSYDGLNNIWVGNIDGLYVFNSVDGKLLYDFSDIVSQNVSDIEMLNDSITYVSTFANGLYEFKNYNYSKNIALPSQKVSDLHHFQERLAVGTDKGAVIYNAVDESQIYINQSNLLSTNLINTVHLNDYLWLGTNEGLHKIDIKEIADKPVIKLAIKSIKADEIEMELSEEFTFAKEKNQSLIIDYIGICYNKQEKISYNYRLVGLDSTWKNTFNTQVTFNALPSGNYNFEIRAKDRVDNESNLARIKIYIVPPWYERWIVKVIGLFLFGFLIYFMTKTVLNRRNEKQKLELTQKRKIDGMKMTALQNHMNPHFISNALYSIHDLIDNKQTWEAGEYTSNFATLIRRSMRYATMERITLREEIDFLKLYMELESQRTDCFISTEMLIDPVLNSFIDTLLLPPLIIQPLLENAFKHAFLEESEDPLVKVEFKLVDEHIQCTILDNGIGYDQTIKTKKNNSTALKIIEERLELNAKQLGCRNVQSHVVISSVENKDGATGTTIKLLIDIKNADE